MSQVHNVVGASQEDIDAITRAAEDYLEGYVSADASRHLGSYHAEAIKRRFSQGDEGVFEIVSLSPQVMADYAALQTPQSADVDIVIDGVYNDIATVRVYSPWWVDFLHVVKARGVWKLFHVTWYRRENKDD